MNLKESYEENGCVIPWPEGYPEPIFNRVFGFGPLGLAVVEQILCHQGERYEVFVSVRFFPRIDPVSLVEKKLAGEIFELKQPERLQLDPYTIDDESDPETEVLQ